MLFKFFSWQEFLLAAAALSLVWYGVVWLLFFRKNKAAPSAPLPHGWDSRVDVLDDELMGKRALSEGESTVEAGELGFASKEEKLGVIADVQEHIRTVCRELEAGLAKKEDYLLGFADVLAGYAIPSASRAPLEEFIREHVPFFISEEELESLWG